MLLQVPLWFIYACNLRTLFRFRFKLYILYHISLYTFYDKQ